MTSMSFGVQSGKEGSLLKHDGRCNQAMGFKNCASCLEVLEWSCSNVAKASASGASNTAPYTTMATPREGFNLDDLRSSVGI